MLIRAFLISLLTGLIFTPLVRRIAKKMKITIQDTPSLGGIAIYSSFIIAIISSLPLNSNVVGILIGSTLIIILGIIDDIKELPPSLTLIGQIVGLTILICFGIKTQIIIIPPWLNLFVTALWVLGITNALNFLDILDGLASGISLIASLTFFLTAMFTNNIIIGTLALALAGSTLAFLRYNFPPAKIYMGNSGSLFLGFTLAAIAITISYAPLERKIALLTPIIILSLPVYDIFFVTLMRLKNRRSIFKKSKDHFALRLISIGYNKRKVLLFMYGFSLIFSVSALIISRVTNQVGILILAVVAIICLIIGNKISKISIDG